MCVFMKMSLRLFVHIEIRIAKQIIRSVLHPFNKVNFAFDPDFFKFDISNIKCLFAYCYNHSHIIKPAISLMYHVLFDVIFDTIMYGASGMPCAHAILTNVHMSHTSCSIGFYMQQKGGIQ